MYLLGPNHQLYIISVVKYIQFFPQKGWDVLRLGTFYSWDLLELGRFGAGTFSALGLFVTWDVLGLGCYGVGTFWGLGSFEAGTFWGWDVL